MAERLLHIPPTMRRALLPLVVVGAGVLASVWLWAELRGAQRDQLAHIVQSAAEESAQAVRARFEAQHIAVANLAALWARFDRASPESQEELQEEWVADSSALVEHLPEFERLIWIDLRRDAVWMAKSGGPAARLEADEREALSHLLRAARETSTRRILGPDPGLGAPRHHVVAPASLKGKRQGVLIATASPGRSLEPITRPLLSRFQIEAIWEGVEILRVGEADPEAPPASALLELPRHGRMDAPGHGAMELRLTASPTLARAVVDAAPVYVLVAGVLASALLAALLFANRVLGERSREIAKAHRETEGEAKRAREAERAAFQLATELEDRVADRTAQLADAVEQLEAFNYSVSHDLRSPLGAIVNFCAIVREEHGPELGAEGTDLVARIGRSAQGAVAMMDGLLELSRLGRAPVALQRVDMEALARESMEQARSAPGSRAVRFELGSLPPAWGDPALLRLVFSNLLRNALKYSQSREKPRIHVSGHAAGNELVYAVRDDGVGFDMRYVSKLFRPFQRLHGASDFPGSGIGLAIVARAVRRHGGRVWAEGELDRGATFSFALPAERTRNLVAP